LTRRRALLAWPAQSLWVLFVAAGNVSVQPTARCPAASCAPPNAWPASDRMRETPAVRLRRATARRRMSRTNEMVFSMRNLNVRRTFSANSVVACCLRSSRGCLRHLGIARVDGDRRSVRAGRILRQPRGRFSRRHFCGRLMSVLDACIGDRLLQRHARDNFCNLPIRGVREPPLPRLRWFRCRNLPRRLWRVRTQSVLGRRHSRRHARWRSRSVSCRLQARRYVRRLYTGCLQRLFLRGSHRRGIVPVRKRPRVPRGAYVSH